MAYQPRSYRGWVERGDLVSFSVTVKETDLLVRARSDLSPQAVETVNECRSALEGYIKEHPQFLYTLEPLRVADDAPALVKEMALAAEESGVGPMAAVAGAIAEAVGRRLLELSDEVIVENGGDIFISSQCRRRIALYAGESPLSGRVAFEVQPEQTPLGVCTSSGTVGHSLSFGLADAVVCFSPSTALADAAATAIANRVLSTEDIHKAIEFAQGIPRLSGVAIIKGDALGLWGKLTIASVDGITG
ncbi:MAG: UPF0280 family protein [Chloroflexota bacterium]